MSEIEYNIQRLQNENEKLQNENEKLQNENKLAINNNDLINIVLNKITNISFYIGSLSLFTNINIKYKYLFLHISYLGQTKYKSLVSFYICFVIALLKN
jgi:hypothetical protein